jgi:hypothetical protein
LEGTGEGNMLSVVKKMRGEGEERGERGEGRGERG